MIKAHGLTFSYTGEPVLKNVTFTISPDTIVGLVGPNGAGKSTLFRLIKKEEAESGGKLEVTGKVGHVPQEVKNDPTLDKAKNVKEYLDPTHKKQDHELEYLIRNLELNVALTDPPHNFSGGQKTRLALARALITEPDILLLDEPTNFLDVKGTRWVMNFLKSYPKTLIVISHDLKLLDKVIDKVLYLNPHTQKIEEYKGNYSQYEKKKEEVEKHLVRHIKQEQQHIKRMEEGLKKLAGRKSEKGVRQKIQLQKRIEKVKENLPEMPPQAAKIHLSLPDPAPCGELPINIKHVYKSYDTPVLEDVSFYMERGERLALIGPNGAGKSTLIKCILSITDPDSGEVRLDPRTKIGYYSQEQETLKYDSTPFDTIDLASNWEERRVRTHLAKFLFTGKKVFQKIESLSGGEKTRLAIAALVVKNNNVLILDEPTTYLDPLSQRIILEALKEYKGAMLIVSHTQDFIKELSPKRVLFLPENKLTLYSDDALERVAQV